jgi:aryl-phospho-beta-D-glucosidase BglC (GH1 family)
MLRRGVNLSGWFAQGSSDPAHLQLAVTADDIQRIRRMGFDHVRLPVDPLTLAPDGRLDLPDLNALYYLDDAIRLALDGGLAVVVDLHPQSGWSQRLATDQAAVEGVAALWTILGHRLRSYDPDRVLIEVLNEPGIADPAVWARIQRRLADSIRSAAPRLTLIATGPAFSAVDQLEQIQPLDDPNVIYGFHLYEPYVFTHQGATWGTEPVRGLHGVPYPFNPTALGTIVPTISDARARDLLASYAQQQWTGDRIDALVERAAAWRERFGAPVICTEFGAYRVASPPDDRVLWLRDVRTSLERRRIAWTTWEYAGGFGVVDGPAGQRVIHAPTARALFGE